MKTAQRGSQSRKAPLQELLSQLRPRPPQNAENREKRQKPPRIWPRNHHRKVVARKFCLYESDHEHLLKLCGGRPGMRSAIVRLALRRLERVSEEDLRQSLQLDGVLEQMHTRPYSRPIAAGDTGEDGVED